MSVDGSTSMPAAGDRQNGTQPQQKRGSRTLWIVAAIVVLGLALLAGKDDIRKFHRMRSM